MSSNTFTCPVCRYDGLATPPYYQDAWGSPSWDICPCCGTHFGYHDAAAKSDATKRALIHERLRQRWIAGGMRWHALEQYLFLLNERWGGISPAGMDSASARPPAGWDPVAQLERLRWQLESQADDETW